MPLLSLGLGACGKSLDRQVADSVRSLDGLALKEDQVEVVSTRESGDSLLAEVRVTTAVRLVKKKGKWEVDEIRLGDRRWERADHILALLDEERRQTTMGQLRQLHRAVQEHRKAKGSVPQVEEFAGLVDVLYPSFLNHPLRLDAWSNSFSYTVRSAGDYDLRSPGADGLRGTADDVVLEELP